MNVMSGVQVASVTLPYDTIEGVRARMAEVAPHLAEEAVEPPMYLNGHYYKVLGEKGGKLSDAPLASSISNFYMTDVITRNSVTMAHCVKARKEMFTGQ